MWGRERDLDSNIKRGSEGERKRVTETDLVENNTTPWILMASCWCSFSGLLCGEIPTKHRVLWINICSGKVGMPRCLPGGTSLTVSLKTDSRSVASSGVLWFKASGMNLGDTFGGLGHLLSFLSHDCPMYVWPSWSGEFYKLPVYVREDRCSLSLTRGYASPLGCGTLCKLGLSRACDLWPPLPWTQSQLISRTASEFGFLVNTFFFLSLVYSSLDLR